MNDFVIRICYPRRKYLSSLNDESQMNVNWMTSHLIERIKIDFNCFFLFVTQEVDVANDILLSRTKTKQDSMSVYCS